MRDDPRPLPTDRTPALDGEHSQAPQSALDGGLAAEQPSATRSAGAGFSEYVPYGYAFISDHARTDFTRWADRFLAERDDLRWHQEQEREHGSPRGYWEDSYLNQPEPTPDWYELPESARREWRGVWEELGYHLQNGNVAAADSMWAGLELELEHIPVALQAREIAVEKYRHERQETARALLRRCDEHYSASTELAIDAGPPEGVQPERYARYLRLLAGDVSAKLAVTGRDLEQVTIHHKLLNQQEPVELKTTDSGVRCVSYRLAPDFEEVYAPYDSPARDVARLATGIAQGLHPRYVAQRVSRNYPAEFDYYSGEFRPDRRPLPSMGNGNETPPQIRPGDRAQALAGPDYAGFALDVPDLPQNQPDVKYIMHADHLHQNAAQLRKHFGPGMMIADCRKNARNHSVAAVRAFEWAGYDRARASNVREALHWRKHGAAIPIWVDGRATRADLSAAMKDKREIELTVAKPDHLRDVLAVAGETGRKARVWLEVDVSGPRGEEWVPSEELLQTVALLWDNPAKVALKGLFTRLKGPDSTAHPLHSYFAERMEAAYGLVAGLPGSEPVCLIGEGLTRPPADTTFPQAIDPGAAAYGLLPKGSPLAGMGLVPAIELLAKATTEFQVPRRQTVSYDGGRDRAGGTMVAAQLGYNSFTPFADYEGDPHFTVGVAGVRSVGEQLKAVGQPTMNNFYFRTRPGQVKPCDMVTIIGCEQEDPPPSVHIPRGGHIFDVPLGIHGGEVVRYVKYPGHDHLTPVTDTAPYTTEARAVVKYQRMTENVRRFREILGDDVELTIKIDSAAEAPPAGATAPIEHVSTVKADGYGHDLVQSARAAVAGGADKVAVGSIREALVLRRKGLFHEDGTEVPVVCWFHSPDADYDSAIRANIEIGVKNMNELIPVIQAARRTGQPATISLEALTGLHRGAATPAEFERMVRLITHAFAEGELDITTVYQHFASHDPAPAPRTDRQDAVLAERLATCRRLGLYDAVSPTGKRPSILTQAAASIAIDRPDLAYDSVAPGTDQYFAKETLEVHVPVQYSEYVPEDHYKEIGSGWWSTGTNIAVTQLGTGDGLPPLLKESGTVRVGDKRYRIVDIGPDFMVVDTEDDEFPDGTIMIMDEITAAAAGAETNEVKFTTCIHGMPIVAAEEDLVAAA